MSIHVRRHIRRIELNRSSVFVKLCNKSYTKFKKYMRSVIETVVADPPGVTVALKYCPVVGENKDFLYVMAV